MRERDRERERERECVYIYEQENKKSQYQYYVHMHYFIRNWILCRADHLYYPVDRTLQHTMSLAYPYSVFLLFKAHANEFMGHDSSFNQQFAYLSTFNLYTINEVI